VEKLRELRAALAEPEQSEPVPPFGSKRKAAMAIYTPPFKFQSGYIFDSQNLMVADDGDKVEGAVAARVRGWGRLGYLPNGAAIQDEIGQMMADALNAYYAAPPRREPLSDEQLEGIWMIALEANDFPEVFARAIEAAHGITGGKE
jgi:hypothetical protein